MVNIRNKTGERELRTEMEIRSTPDSDSTSDDDVNTERHVATQPQPCAQNDKSRPVLGRRKHRRKKRRVSPIATQHS